MNPGAFLVIVVGMLLLASVVYKRTCCFGGFYNCMVNGCGSSSTGQADMQNAGSGSYAAKSVSSLPGLPSLGAIA